MNTNPKRRERLTLELLTTVEKHHNMSQRGLAREMGIALGLTNSYLKRCVHKGWIKITNAPANRYLYYLTPAGFSEKSRLTAKYLISSLTFYREAGKSCTRIFCECSDAGYQKLLLVGDSDLAEIGSIRSLDTEIEVIGVYDPGASRVRCIGRPVWTNYRDAKIHDAVVVTELADPVGMLKHLKSIVGATPILTLDILPLD